MTQISISNLIIDPDQDPDNDHDLDNDHYPDHPHIYVPQDCNPHINHHSASG